MAWQKEYLVSYTNIQKSKPMKVKATSIEEAEEKFRELQKNGHVEEEEKNFQMNIFEIWKHY